MFPASFQGPQAALSKLNFVVLAASQKWTCPPGATVGQVVIQDGGRGGSYNTGGSGAQLPGGPGGNAGVSIVPLTPGATYTATVGAGSAAAITPTPGGASSFSGPDLTTVTSSNATLKVPGGAAGGGSSPSGGGSFLAPAGSTGYGAGGTGGTDSGAGGSTAGRNGAVIIYYC